MMGPNYYGIKRLDSLYEFDEILDPQIDSSPDALSLRGGTMVNGFFVIQRDNHFGLMNRFGVIVIPIEYDSLTSVDYHHIPHPGPYIPPEMRCLFTKGDRCGSFLIDKDDVILEMDITQREWAERQTWT